jgi:hypothetical protein
MFVFFGCLFRNICLFRESFSGFLKIKDLQKHRCLVDAKSLYLVEHGVQVRALW